MRRALREHGGQVARQTLVVIVGDGRHQDARASGGPSAVISYNRGGFKRSISYFVCQIGWGKMGSMNAGIKNQSLKMESLQVALSETGDYTGLSSRTLRKILTEMLQAFQTLEAEFPGAAGACRCAPRWIHQLGPKSADLPTGQPRS